MSDPVGVPSPRTRRRTEPLPSGVLVVLGVGCLLASVACFIPEVWALGEHQLATTGGAGGRAGIAQRVRSALGPGWSGTLLAASSIGLIGTAVRRRIRGRSRR